MVTEVARQLSLFFKGHGEPCDLADRCDPSDAFSPTKFRLSVLAACARIPRGGWLTYGQLASEMKFEPRRHARAIGQVMAWNPLPLIFPCHRVLSDGGRLGNYGGGLAMKRHLLLREGATGFRD